MELLISSIVLIIINFFLIRGIVKDELKRGKSFRYIKTEELVVIIFILIIPFLSAFAFGILLITLIRRKINNVSLEEKLRENTLRKLFFIKKEKL